MALERSIFARTRPGGTRVAATSDFVTLGGRSVPLRQVFLARPEAISPYALDVARGEVAFVRTPEGLDLAGAHPFFYEAQRRHATHLIVAGLDEVESLGDDLAAVSMKVAFLYSPGRAGSTITGRIAAALPGVQSLSEPDVYAHATLQRRPDDAASEARLVRMLRAVTRILAAHRAAVDPTRRVLLVKQRGMGIFSAPLVQQGSPSSRAVFLDRETSAVVDSYLGAFLHNPVVIAGRRVGLDRLGVRVVRAAVRYLHPWIPRLMPDVLDPALGASTKDGAVEVLAQSIGAMRDAALRQRASGAVRLTSWLRYEDLRGDARGFARALALGVGVQPGPALEAALDEVDAITAIDAQRGSSVESRHVRTIDAQDVRRIETVLETRKSIPPLAAAEAA